jgi:peptidoglycan-N-acetylglucosamine deacetylase
MSIFILQGKTPYAKPLAQTTSQMFNMLLKIAIATVVILSSPVTNAQAPWNKKKCAVALTYDDALNVHLDHAIPTLDSLGLKGTFYLSAFMPGCKNRIEDWRRAASHGHELGNHTLFHPCIGRLPGRLWVTQERDLGRYTMDRFVDEVRMTNIFLTALDGKTKRTFAYTCGDTLVEGQSVIPRITTDFVSARGVKSELIPISTRNLYNVGSYMINGQTSAQMISLVKEAMQKNSAIIFLFHGVGGEHGLNVDLKAHRELLQFLKANEKDIWTAPFMDITEFIRSNTASLQK